MNSKLWYAVRVNKNNYIVIHRIIANQRKLNNMINQFTSVYFYN